MNGLARIPAALLGGLALLAMSAGSIAGELERGDSFQLHATSSGCISKISGATDADAVSSPGYREDRAQSTALTRYLDQNRLPMVGAQVFTNSGGNRQVLLYGFVATDRGKQNAATRARQYLSDPKLLVINRIVVRSELQTPGSGGASSSSPGSSDSYTPGELGSTQSYQSEAEEAEREQQNVQSQRESEAILLLMRLLMGLL